MKHKQRIESISTVMAFVIAIFWVIACVSSKGYKRVPTTSKQQKTEELIKLFFSKETTEKSSNVSAVERITNTKEIERRPQLSSDGEKLTFAVFELDQDKYEFGNIWVLNLKSGTLVRVTSSKADERNPTWSKDGQHIFFETTMFGQRNIARIHSSEAGGITQITNGKEEILPNCSHDGTMLCFSVITSSESLVCTSRIDGRAFTQLTQGSQPSWSPDDKKIVYVRRKDDKNQGIWLMNVNGSNQTQLTVGGFDQLPSFSPDGKHIVFSAVRGKKKDFDIWLMKVDGSSLTQLTTNESADLYPIFGKDSSDIYFCSNRGGKWDIWKLKTQIEEK